MARNDEIHSTGKLLDLIRNQNNVNSMTSLKNKPPGAVETKKTKLSKTISFQKKATIGIDIGHSYIKMAKIHRLADKSFQLLDYLDIPLNTPIALKDPKIRQLLKSTLDQFCENNAKYELWGAIASANVETRYLRIPKLPYKQIANAVFWTFTKKVSFDQNTEVLDYEIIGDVIENGVKKTVVMAFKAPKEEIEDLKSAFIQIGYPLSGITIVPFAIQNLFRTKIIPSSEQDICCLFIGRDWSRIAIYNNGNLVLSRGIKAGMRSMVEAINISMHKQDEWPQAEEASLEDLPGKEEEYSMAIDPAAQKLFFEFLRNQNAFPEQTADRSKINQQQVFQMVLPAMERLIRQVERTFEHYALNFHHEGARRIFISGQITSNEAVVNHIGRQLDLPISVMDPFPVPAPFTEKIKLPATEADRESYVPAIGIALSGNNRTPNFLFTHQNKDEAENISKNNMRILTACLVCLVVLVGIFSWQERHLSAKRDQVEKINSQLLAYNPPAEKEMALALYAQSMKKQTALNQIALRYKPAAIINELAKITPANIRLLNMAVSLDEKKTKDTVGAPGTIVIKGIIFSEAESFDTVLTNYLFNLKNSPIFGKPNVEGKRVDLYNAQEVMWFSAKLEII